MPRTLRCAAMTVAGVVLAAGAGRRYGMPKALIPWNDGLLVEHAAAVLTRAGLAPVLVVVGAAAPTVKAAAPLLTYVDNPDWASGLASSLRAGLAAVTGTRADAAVLTLVDMPGLTPEGVRRIAAHASPTALAIGGYGTRRAHPVLLGRDHWQPAAASATGDRGARDYLRTRDVLVVPVGDVADDTDLDVPRSE